MNGYCSHGSASCEGIFHEEHQYIYVVLKKVYKRLTCQLYGHFSVHTIIICRFMFIATGMVQLSLLVLLPLVLAVAWTYEVNTAHPYGSRR